MPHLERTSVFAVSFKGPSILSILSLLLQQARGTYYEDIYFNLVPTGVTRKIEASVIYSSNFALLLSGELIKKTPNFKEN